ncbi:MAG: hypothetical protein AAF913_17395 [Pseudomonadota bacterium]
MSAPLSEGAEASWLRRRREDAAAALPAIGVLLLASPVVDAFAGLGVLGPVPFGFLYLFLAWAGLILLTARVSLRLSAED